MVIIKNQNGYVDQVYYLTTAATIFVSSMKYDKVFFIGPRLNVMLGFNLIGRGDKKQNRPSSWF